MTVLAPDQIASYAYQAGFRGQPLQWIVQIAMRESGGKTDAWNPNVSTGDNSVGMTQVNILGGNAANIARILQGLGYHTTGDPSELKAMLSNPAINFQVAYKLSNGGTNFEPWRSHSPGWEGPQGFLTKTEQYAPAAASAAAKVQLGGHAATGQLFQNIQQAQAGQGGALTNLTSWLTKQIGKPYIFGASDPNGAGFDCSGLIAAAYKSVLGVNIPAYTFTMKDYGAPVGFDEMQPGDMIFKHGAAQAGHEDGQWGHVGIYIGGGQVIDAPHTGATVRVTPVDNWKDGLNGVRRLVDATGAVITGAGLTPQFGAGIRTVPLAQAMANQASSLTQPLNLDAIDPTKDQTQEAVHGLALPIHNFDTLLAGEGAKIRSLV